MKERGAKIGSMDLKVEFAIAARGDFGPYWTALSANIQRFVEALGLTDEIFATAVDRFNSRGLSTLSKKELRDALTATVAAEVYAQIEKVEGAEDVFAEVLKKMRQDIEDDRVRN